MLPFWSYLSSFIVQASQQWLNFGTPLSTKDKKVKILNSNTGFWAQFQVRNKIILQKVLKDWHLKASREAALSKMVNQKQKKRESHNLQFYFIFW